MARNVHEMAEALSHAIDDLRHAEIEIEACGLALYHVLPPELASEAEGRKWETYCDYD